MSCQSRANTISGSAGRAAGVAAQAGASAYLAAQSLNKAAVKTIATANQASETLTKSPTLNRLVRLSPPMLALRALNRGRQIFRAVSPANRIGRLAGRVTGIAGTIRGEFSRQGQVSAVTLNRSTLGLSTGQRTVPMWRSSLTPMLNRANQLGIGEKVVSDTGVLVKGQGLSWHRGTTTVALPNQGGERTVTQVQSLSYPANHYFYDRTLTDRETAKLVTGQVKPENLSGFVGRVDPTESALPGYTAMKGAYYRAHIYATANDQTPSGQPS